AVFLVILVSAQMVYRVVPGLKFMRIYLVVHLVLGAIKLRVFQMEMRVNDATVPLVLVAVALIVGAVVLATGELAGVGEAVPLEVLRVGLGTVEPGPVAGVGVLQRGGRLQRGGVMAIQ